jgi:hypothetical protein
LGRLGFWAQSDKRGVLHLNIEAPDPAYADTDVFVLRAQIMKICGTDQAAPLPEGPPGRPRGRQPKLDWEIFAVEVTRRVLQNSKGKIRKTARGLTPDMAQWCVDEFGDHPRETQIREHINKVLAYLQK